MINFPYNGRGGGGRIRNFTYLSSDAMTDLVRVKLTLPLLHVGGGLLQRAGQPGVVVLQSRQLNLPLLQKNTVYI